MLKKLIVILVVIELLFGFRSRAFVDDGALIKGGGPEVYFIEHGLKRWIINPSVFDKLSFDWRKIKTISDMDLGSYPPGNKLDNPNAFPEGILIKSSVSPKVYLFDQNKFRWIPDQYIFSSNNFSWDNIVIVSDQRVKSFAKGANVRYGEFIATPTTFITEKPQAEIGATTQVSFRYSGNNPSGPLSELSWDTFLDGFDARWVPTTAYTRVINLPAVDKTYTFYVRSRNKEGKVDPRPASFSFTVSGFSTAYKQLKITGVKRSGAFLADEYVKIGNPSKENVNVTGLTLKNKKNETIIISTAIETLYLASGDYEKNIILEPGKTLTVFSGASPIGKNFRLNKCTGYLNSYYNFSPKLPQECPKPLDQSLVSLSKNCQDYVKALGPCVPPNTADIKVTYDKQCTDYLLETFNYSNCIVKNQIYPDFLKNDWYVYLNRVSGFLDDAHDDVKLLDRNNDLIDISSY